METINDQTQFDKELRDRFLLMETVLQNLPLGIAVNRINDGAATLVNKGFSESYGWPDEDLTDTYSFFTKVYPDEAYRKEIMARVMADIERGDPERMAWNHIVITTKTGEKRIINARNIPLYEQNLMISTVIDVTNNFEKDAEIRQTKANQEALINGTQDLIWSVDNELRIITANQSFRKMIKMLTGKIVKEGDSALVEEFGEDQIIKWRLYYERALKGEHISIEDQHYNTTEQAVEYSLISMSPMFNDENILFGVACYSKNITTQKFNLLALEKARKEVEKIMASSLDMICSFDTNGLIMSVSPASEIILGYRPDELIGKQLLHFVFREDVEKTRQMSAFIMEGNDVTNFENRYVHKNGSVVPLIWSARWDPNDKIRYSIARDATAIKKSEHALIESEKKYKYLFENNPLPILICDFETFSVIDCNEEAINKYGYTREQFSGLRITDIQAQEDMPLFYEEVKATEIDLKSHKKVRRHRKKNGEMMYMVTVSHIINLNNKQVILIIADDITESRYYHELDKLEKNILEINARNDKNLKEVISFYLSGIETLHPGMLCSMQEKKGNRLFDLASPSLPKAYLEAIAGIEIGNNVGSCGTAAFLKQKVIVTDIANDVRWGNYKDIAGIHHFKSCWSYPILDRKNNVMATFACYYREIKLPAEAEEKTIQRAGNILQVILESYNRDQALKISNERFEYVTKATSDIIWDWNLETNTVYYSANMQKLFGHTPSMDNDNLPFFWEHVHPDDRERVILYPDQVRRGSMINWMQEYRFKKANGEYAFVQDKGIVIRDKNGIGTRMIGALQDITVLKQNELKVIQQNEQLTEIALINAHEIRRPVATILGLMQLFNKENILDDNTREVLKHLETTTVELDMVIKRLISKTVI